MIAANDVPDNSSAFSVEHITPTEQELSTVPQKSYKCDICGLQVKTLANLRIHRVKTHRIVEVSHRNHIVLKSKFDEINVFNVM